MPKATVNGSPRSMRRSPGLSRPRRARGPAVSIRWQRQRRPVPAEQRDRLAFGEPGSQVRQQVPDAARRDARRGLEGRQLVDLVDRAQAVGGADEEVGGVLDEAARPRQLAQRLDEEGRGLHERPVRVRLPADDPDPRAGPDPLVAEDLAQRPRLVARLARQAEVLEPVASHRQRRRAGHAPALVADEDRPARRPRPTIRMASSNRGSKPVR